MNRAWFRDIAFMGVGGLVAIAVLAPQLVDARSHFDRLKGHEKTIAARCHIFVDGSAVCPPAVFHVDRVAK